MNYKQTFALYKSKAGANLRKNRKTFFKPLIYWTILEREKFLTEITKRQKCNLLVTKMLFLAHFNVFSTK